jgi:hypothetical protein
MSAAEPCPSGYYCPDPTAAPVPAPVGSYSLGGFTAAAESDTLQCQLGYTCTSTGAIGPHAAPCAAG